MSRTIKFEPRPHLACEITADRIIAARNGERALDTYTSRTLPAGALAPNLTGTNVLDPAALRQAIADALATVGSRTKELTVLLPDAAARVVLLDFDTLPEKRADAEAIVRFRLKKALPFDVEKSSLSFQASRADGAVRMVAAVTLSSTLEEYESAFRDAGYEPGIVLPATLAALGPVHADTPVLVVKVDTVTTSVAICQNQDLSLFRTLENPAGALDPDRLAEEVYPSLVFFEDTFGSRVERVLVGGLIGADQLAQAFETHTGIRPQELVTAAQVGSAGSTPRPLLAGVLGALIG